MDCCSDWLEGFEIWVGYDWETVPEKHYTHTGSVATSAESPIVVTLGVIGWEFFVYLPGAGRTLTFCELEVYSVAASK
eukprot:2278408-Rhodomonas_salina.1